jgi:hypothetical protein
LNPLWTKKPIISPLIQKVWSSPFSGSPNYIWESKLKTIKTTLKDWLKASYIPLHQEGQEKVEIMSRIQQQLEEEEVTYSLMNQ